MTWEARIRLRLGDLDLDVALEGGHAPVALVGPNGAGKTTLLRTLAGIHRPEAGFLRVDDVVLLDVAAGIHLPPEARRIGYVPQGYGLFPHLSVLGNAAFGTDAPAAVRIRAARRLLARLGAEHLAHRRPGTLSGGERQRVALARALRIAPRLLLLDEPLSALDASARRALRAFLSQHLAELGRPALVVTHDVRDLQALNAEVFVLEGGRIVQRGSVADLAAHPATAFVAELVESPALTHATPAWGQGLVS